MPAGSGSGTAAGWSSRPRQVSSFSSKIGRLGWMPRAALTCQPQSSAHLHFAAYNFTWAHSSLKGCTPAMAAGIARKPWKLAELLTA